MLKRFRIAALGFAAAALMLGSILSGAQAQVPSGQPVYGIKKTVTLAVTALGVATLNTPDIINYGWSSIQCFYSQTSHTGSAQSTVITIYSKDEQSGNYVSLLASAAYTTDAEQAAISVGPGLPVTANVSVNALLGRLLRVGVTQSGSASTVTGKLYCVLSQQ